MQRESQRSCLSDNKKIISEQPEDAEEGWSSGKLNLTAARVKVQR